MELPDFGRQTPENITWNEGVHALLDAFDGGIEDGQANAALHEIVTCDSCRRALLAVLNH